MSTKVIPWSLSTIRDHVLDVLRNALNLFFLDVEMRRVYLEDDKIVIAGEFSRYGTKKGGYKVVLRNENLSLVSYEIS